MAAPAGFRHLPAHLGAAEQALLLADVRGVIRRAPLFVPTMPRSGPNAMAALDQPRRSGQPFFFRSPSSTGMRQVRRRLRA